jgi:multiple sugar transport system substrate-binding protein
MTRSRIAAVAVMGAVALAVSGCSAAGAASDDDEATVTFWGSYGNGGNSAQQDALDNVLIPAFEAEHPDIDVAYVDIPYDSLLQKLTTSAAGDELPDLVRADLGWVPQFAELGVLVPLSQEMDDFDELAEATYPGVLATNLYEGEHYGLPLDTNTRVMVSNQAALDAAGLSAPPATFDELRALADAVKGTGTYAFAENKLQAWNIMPWIWSAGGDIADPELTTSTGYLDSDESVAGIQLLVDLYQEDAIPNLIVGNEGATATSDGLPGGQYATILDGPWMQGVWSGQYPDFDPIYSTVPAGDGGSVSVVGGEDIVLTQSSEHKDAAMEFIRFTQSEQFQIEMVKTGQMTVIPAFAEQQSEIDPFYATFAEQLETAKNRLAIPDASKVDAILAEELLPAFEGTVTVQEALSNAAAAIDDLLPGAK